MNSNSTSPVILSMNNITKDFPGVRALDDVSIELRKGEVLGLLGENGAGKSTLIKILAGVYSLEQGEIFIDGKPVIFKNPKESLEQGIRVIYQEIPTFEPLTVVENIFAGEYKYTRMGTIDWTRMIQDSQKMLLDFGLKIDPLTPMEHLTVGEKQIIEIVKALQGEAKILVMDEPTSSLSRADTEQLYTIIRKLKAVGVSVIYITHRMEEIFQITDRVFVLRDGKKEGYLQTNETNSQHLVNLIVGKSFSELYPKQHINKGKVIFEVKELSYFTMLRNISFKIREGEIVAIYGLIGSGMHKLLNVLVGDLKKTQGEIFIEGEKIEVNHPFIAKKHRIGFIPTDRREEGIAQTMDVKSNVVSANIENIGQGIVFNKKIQVEHTSRWIHKLNIKTSGLDQLMQFLSGGNQQKAVISKWLEAKSKILLMSEPSRGIDVGAKAEIYGIIEELCKEGMGVIMVSTELPEIMSISDRILVMKKGEIVKEVNTKETSQEELMSTVCS